MIASRSGSVLAVTLALLVTACGSGERTDSPAEGRLEIVATTPILGEAVGRIVAEDASVEVLMAPGQDPHGFAPSARQAAALRNADLVVANGLGLEEALSDTLAAAEADGVEVLHTGELVDPIPAGGDEPHDTHAEDEHDDHGDGPDPHFWLDPVRMADVATAVADAIAASDANSSTTDWDARGSTLSDHYLEVHAEVEEIVGAVPDRCRVLVTAHDSLRYFAERYDFELVGSVVPGTSTQVGASAGHVADLARTLEERGVPAVFAETSESTRLANTLANEVGRDIEVVALPAGTLGEPDSPTGTYRGMLTTTAELVASALQDC